MTDLAALGVVLTVAGAMGLVLTIVVAVARWRDRHAPASFWNSPPRLPAAPGPPTINEPVIISFPPYTRWPDACPKCGQPSAHRTRYVAEFQWRPLWYSADLGDVRRGPPEITVEHLVQTCAACGYARRVRPVDAPTLSTIRVSIAAPDGAP